MTNFDFEQFLSEVKSIHEKYRLTGENFNVFKILGVETSEIRHSAFLAELLNVQGSHGQGSKYLDLFLEQIGVTDFDPKTSKIIAEYHIGEVDNEEKEGGYIDILMQDKENRCIVIDNKIYAGDQCNQLERYYNFIHQQHEGSKLFYLNLFGDKPSNESTGNLKDVDYSIITYRSDILQWLERCLNETDNISTIRETIKQYINVIKILTKQMQPMDNKIVELITKSSESLEAASRTVACFDHAKQKILNNFWKTLCSTLEEKGVSVKMENINKLIEKYYNGTKEIIRIEVMIPEVKINGYQLCWGAEIDNNFYTNFCFCNSKGEKVKALTVNEKDEANGIVEFLNKNFYKTCKKTDKDATSLGWKYSRWQGDLNFNKFNSSLIFKLVNQVEIENVVKEIVEDALKDIEAVKDLWNRKK